jgi:hypothetical protein
MNEDSKPKSRREARIARGPEGAWPQEMRAEKAAAYCDEPSVDAFIAKVAKGIYPAPLRALGCRPKWSRARLDVAIARRHGLHVEAACVAENVEDLI